MSKRQNVKRQIQGQPAQSGVPMVAEFDYKVWVIPYNDYDAKAKEISEYLNQKHLEGWNMPHLPNEAYHEKRIIVTATFVRQTERKVLAPVGLA